MKTRRALTLLTVLLGLMVGREAQAFYNPSSGRWLSRDPIGEKAHRLGKPWVKETMNPNHFVQNDPIRRYDRLGLFGNPVRGPIGPIGPSTWSWANCPRTCGPDYTAAVNAEIAALRTYMGRAPHTPGGHSLLFDYLNAGVLLSWFKQVALSLDYDAQAKEAGNGEHPFDGCPSLGCSGTISLCGKCVGSDVPGNIMFGFTATASGLPDYIRNAGAAWAEAWDWDGERDVAALLFGDQDKNVFPLGAKLYEGGSSDICSVLGNLPNHANSTCKPCSKPGSFTSPTKFRRISYPIYY